jgi:hypothetical protein
MNHNWMRRFAERLPGPDLLNRYTLYSARQLSHSVGSCHKVNLMLTCVDQMLTSSALLRASCLQ